MKRILFSLLLLGMSSILFSQAYKGSGGAFSLGMQSMNTAALPQIAQVSPDIAETGFNFGGYMYWQFHRFTFGAKAYGVYMSDEELDNLEFTLSGGAILGEIGYKVIYGQKHALYPFVGVGYGGITYEVEDEGDIDIGGGTPSGTLLTKGEFRWDGLVYDAGLRWEWFIDYDEEEPSAGFLGLEAGYQFSVPNNKWETSGGGAVNGVAEDMDFNGWFVKLTLGGFDGFFE